MQIPGRGVAAACLAVLVALAGGAVALSVAVHPRSPDSELRSAVAQAVGARSFTLQLVYESVAGPAVPAAQRAALSLAEDPLVIYQAPDRLQVVYPGAAGQQGVEVVAGATLYTSTDSGAHWNVQHARNPRTNLAAVTVHHLLEPLHDAVAATDLAGSRTQLRGTLTSNRFLADSGLGAQQGLPPGPGQVEATIAGGGWLQGLGARFASPSRIVYLLYRFSDLGHAPAIVVPAVSPGG